MIVHAVEDAASRKQAASSSSSGASRTLRSYFGRVDDLFALMMRGMGTLIQRSKRNPVKSIWSSALTDPIKAWFLH